MIRTRSTRADAVVDHDGHTVTVCLVPWDEPSDVTDNGRDRYSESFARGGLTPASDKVLGEVEHDGVVVARALEVNDTDHGLYATARVSRSTAGRDLIADIDAGIVEAVSVDFEDDPTPVPAGGAIRRSNAKLTRFAFVTDPQHQGARIVGRRSQTGADMADEDTTTDEDTSTDEQLDEQLEDTTTDEHQRSNRSARRARGARRPAIRASGRFRSFGHFAHAALHGEVEGDELARYQRALADADMADMPGLVHEEWIREIIDLQRTMTPTIEEFSSRPLPESGDSVSQPKVTGRPTVGQQAAEGDEVSSAKVTIGKASWSLETFAGGQNMSLQAALRSSPEYLNEVMRLHLIEMAESKNAAAVADIEAIDFATNSTKVDKTASYADGEFIDDIVDVCVGMLATLKRFPELVLIPTNVYGALAKAKDSEGRPLYPSVAPMNPAGSMSLTSSTGTVSDLAWRVEPELTDDHIIVAIRDGFRTFNGPVGTLSADVPANLGRDVAVYSFAAMGVVDAAGIWEISPAA